MDHTIALIQKSHDGDEEARVQLVEENVGLIWCVVRRFYGRGVGKMPVLLELFLAFAKIGLFTFGGGYAMISVIENTCVEQKQWISHEDMMNITVIAESTPGPIAINCATL